MQSIYFKLFIGVMSALAPKIGPLGLSPKIVGDDITKASGDGKGLRITVRLTIQNRQNEVQGSTEPDLKTFFSFSVLYLNTLMCDFYFRKSKVLNL